MYKICKTEQSAKRQREIALGLLNAMSTQPYEDISISDLCAQLELPRKTFYRYFSSKEGALYALIDSTLFEAETYLGTLGISAGKRSPMQDTESFFQYWLMQKPFLDALQKNHLSALIVQRSLEFTSKENSIPLRFLDEVQQEMIEHVTIFCVCGLMSIVLLWHQNGYRQSPKQMAKIATKLMTEPLFQNIERPDKF